VRAAQSCSGPGTGGNEGAMWPIAYALTELTADEARIGALVKKAVS
jgi:hypothetical protein